MTGLCSDVSTIDVILPAYNAEKTIVEALRSLQAQTFTDFRVLVVNDGSTDDTASIVSGMAETDPRIVLLSQPNGGIVDALNMGLSHATAEFIARFDADDISFPERFEAQLSYLKAHPDCVAVGSNAHHIDGAGRRTGATTAFGNIAPDATWAPAREPYLMHPFLMLRRQVLSAVGGYRHVYHAEDVDLYWRLLDVGRLHNLMEVHGEYRVHVGSISSKSILNGRVLAVSSQRAALSYSRRQAGKEDLVFEKALSSALQKAEQLQKMIGISEHDLTNEERSSLCIATAAKILETSQYRPFEITEDDCHFIRLAIAEHAHSLSSPNQAEIRFRQIQAARRLLASGRWQEFVKLTPSSLYLNVLIFHVRLKTGRAWGHVD